MKFLFERLQTDPPPFDLKAAVLNNLQRLVSSRESLFAVPTGVHSGVATAAATKFDVLNCSMPSVVELGRDNTVTLEAFGARLRGLIAHYEPRLCSPRIELERDGAAAMRLVVSGWLAMSGGMQPLRFPVELRAEN